MTSVRFVAVVKWEAKQKVALVTFVTVGKLRKSKMRPLESQVWVHYKKF